MKFILYLYGLLSACCLYAQSPRTVTCINENWRFTKDKNSEWQTVNLPHTWNVDDVMDDTPGYYRGDGWYKRSLFIPSSLKGKMAYLFIEAANQVAEVFVNGKKAGHHTGGYSAFYIPLTDFLQYDRENELLVKVDNSHNVHIPPLSADFTFYGGLYRDVWLVTLDPVHFANNDHGTNGVFISTPLVTEKNAEVHIKATVSNEGRVKGKLKVHTIIRDRDQQVVATVSSKLTSEAGADRTIQQQVKIGYPKLWSPEDPYLYTVTSEIHDEAGALLDRVTHPLGFRWFYFDPDKGFFLNGKSYKLVGTSRHQDYKGLGNAVPDSLAVEDVRLLKKMGGNFLRVAHYPQDVSVLRACDSLGILASVEIPVVNEITESDTFYNNCAAMQVEMIRQHYNHPSVIIWCYMNEVLLRPHYNNDKEKQKEYFAAITRLAKRLDSITRREDPYRYTMIAHHGDYKKYRDIELVDIPMIVGWNLYSGWYGAQLGDFPVFLDAFHRDYPAKPVVVSEYGADADPRVRSLQPVRFDKSIEYTTGFHRFYMKAMMERPFVAAAMIWNLADFNSETRTESMPHINNKGLLEWDRAPKDPYYYYKAVLSKEGFVKILGSSRAGGIGNEQGQCLRPVEAATNLVELELIVNDKLIGKQKTENGICKWEAVFRNGINTLEARGTKDGQPFHDRLTVQFHMQPGQLSDSAIAFQQLNVLLGANRYVIDEEQQVWIPDQPYREGSWGHIGGKTFRMPNNSRLPYGTDKNIATTVDDPVYQTQQTGIEKYKLDVPAGEYELTLYFAELLGGAVKGLPYNLNDPDRIEPNGKRVFDIYINGKLAIAALNLAEQYGPATAVQKKLKVNTSGKEGIELFFKPIEGEPVLNALQVRKIDTQQVQATGKQ